MLVGMDSGGAGADARPGATGIRGAPEVDLAENHDVGIGRMDAENEVVAGLRGAGRRRRGHRPVRPTVRGAEDSGQPARGIRECRVQRVRITRCLGQGHASGRGRQPTA